MSKNDSFLQKLPHVDANQEIQQNSLDALNSFLPTDKYCLRDERINDYGVDASLEILEKGHAVNFRSQIQLKGTRSFVDLKDGIYSLQVKTSNLNYLLNSPISLYILYVEEEDKFFFVWAETEFQRFAEQKKDWIKQEKVSLHFNHLLDLDALEKIREKIINYCSSNRELRETLLLANSGTVSIEINPETFEITNKKEIVGFVANFGINLVNEGYYREILHKISLLDLKDKESVSIALVKSYAEYVSGLYRTAQDTVTLIRSNNDDLAGGEQQLASWLYSSCDYSLGKTDSNEYIKNLEVIAEKDDEEKFSSYRFNFAHQLLLKTKNHERRHSAVKNLREELEKLPLQEETKEIRFQHRYHILEAELGTIIGELSEGLGNITIKKSLGVAYLDESKLHKDLATLVSDHHKKVSNWNEGLNDIYKNTENPILRADVAVEFVLRTIGEISVFIHWSKINKTDFDSLEDDSFKSNKKLLDYAIEIYIRLNLCERKLRAKSHLAELIALYGRKAEAENMFSDVFKISNEMGYVHVARNSQNPLSKSTQKIDDELYSTDFNEKLANSSN